MPTCAECNAQVDETDTRCPNCGAALDRRAMLNTVLSRFQSNPRVTLVRVSVADDCCPACAAVQGAHPKENAPALPQPSCSSPGGCRCFYEPVLNDIYP